MGLDTAKPLRMGTTFMMRVFASSDLLATRTGHVRAAGVVPWLSNSCASRVFLGPDCL